MRVEFHGRMRVVAGPNAAALRDPVEARGRAMCGSTCTGKQYFLPHAFPASASRGRVCDAGPERTVHGSSGGVCQAV